jgi:ABC-type sugar transport system permease subunit
MWKWMYDPALGVFNHILKNIFRIPWPWTGWLLDKPSALPSIALMSVWRLMGITMMLFLVGLNNIPRELLEAARIDGANEVRTIWHIVLPMLRPIFLVVLVLRLTTLGVTIEPMVMTDGGPVSATMTYGLQAYKIAFIEGNMRMGYGSTWFIMLGIVSMIIAYVGTKLFGEQQAAA